MRRWFVLLLIALLPLRAWVGDAMAADMLARHAPAATAAPMPAHMAHASEHDCMGHGVMPVPADESLADNGPGFDGDCPTCASCQACSGVALTFQSATVAGAATAQLPVWTPSVLQSADVSRALKPPIS